MLKKYLVILIIFCSFELAGCATGADVGPMVASYSSNQQPKNITLVKDIAVSHVAGGQETNPLWASEISNENFQAALAQSLQQAGLYREYPGSHYLLSANLIQLKQPLVGLNLTVVCTVQYQLENTKDNNMIYNKIITTSYTATFSDSPIAVVRLKKANEGAARENIKQLITDLYHLSKK